MKKYLQILIFTLSILIFIFPYLGSDKYFLIGPDMGFYINEINRYIPDIVDLKNFISSNHEPGFFLFTKIYYNITGIAPFPNFKILLLFLQFYKFLTFFLLGRIIFSKASLATLFLILFGFSVVWINIFYMGIVRQYFADSVAIIIFYLLIKNLQWNYKFYLLSAFLLSFLLVSHKWVTFVTGIFLIFYLPYIFLKKYNKKIHLIFFLIAIISSLPFLSIVLSEYWRVALAISDGMVESATSSSTSWAVGVSIYFWRSPYPGETIYSIFLNDITLFLTFLLLLSRLFIWSRKKDFFVIIIAVFLINIVESRGEFSQRILYYLFLVYFILFLALLGFKHKKILILFMSIYLVVSVIFLSTKKWYLNTEDDILVIKWMFYGVSKKDSLFIVYNWPGMTLAQMWYNTLATAKWNAENYYNVGKIPEFDPGYFFVNWHSYSFTMPYGIDQNLYKNIYVVILPWANNTTNNYWKISILDWDKSIYFKKTDQFCSKKINVFCNTYKYIWYTGVEQ